MWELRRRCLATLHPDFNPDVADVIRIAWQDEDDRVRHFEEIGAVLRRLVDSTHVWARARTAAYRQLVKQLTEAAGNDPARDVIGYVVLSRRPPR